MDRRKRKFGRCIYQKLTCANQGLLIWELDVLSGDKNEQIACSHFEGTK